MIILCSHFASYNYNTCRKATVNRILITEGGCYLAVIQAIFIPFLKLSVSWKTYSRSKSPELWDTLFSVSHYGIESFFCIDHKPLTFRQFRGPFNFLDFIFFQAVNSEDYSN